VKTVERSGKFFLATFLLWVIAAIIGITTISSGAQNITVPADCSKRS
jgi:hypothetical protein